MELRGYNITKTFLFLIINYILLQVLQILL